MALIKLDVKLTVSNPVSPGVTGDALMANDRVGSGVATLQLSSTGRGDFRIVVEAHIPSEHLATPDWRSIGEFTTEQVTTFSISRGVVYRVRVKAMRATQSVVVRLIG